MNVSDWEKNRATIAAAAMKDVIANGVSGADTIAPTLSPALRAQILADTSINPQLRLTVYGMLAGLAEVEPWQPLAPFFVNSFADGSAPNMAGVCRDPFGIVRLRGLFTRASAALNTTAITLPDPYKPARKKFFIVMAKDKACRLDIFTDGSIQIVAADAAAWYDYVSLDGISFDTRP